MIQQGFYIGEDKDWYVMCFYDMRTERDKMRVEDALKACGLDEYSVRKTTATLMRPNSGFTFTSFAKKFSAIFISQSTSAEQMYDTIQHELKHVVEHISEYYEVSPKSEKAAYLQGEIARQMFPAAAMLVCPKCNKKTYKKWK